MPVTFAPYSRAAWIAKLPQPHARLEPELAGDQVELRELGLLQCLRATREDRAAVGHRIVEEQTEELVAYVVVVADRPGVTLGRVALTVQHQLESRAPRHAPRDGGRRDPQPEASAIGGRQRWRVEAVDDHERGVEIIDGERSFDVGTAEAEGSGSEQEMRERRGPANEESRGGRLGRGHGASVPEADLEGTRWQSALQRVGQRSAGTYQCHDPTIAQPP